MLRSSPRVVVVAVLAAVVASVGLAGCGGDDEPTEDRAELEASLGFLVDDLGLTEEQVACAAATIEDQIGGEALDQFSETVRQVDSGEVSVDELPATESDLLTSAIGTCVAES